MNHLAEEQLYEVVFANKPLTDDAQRHLTACKGCQQQLAILYRLGHELNIAAGSQLTPQQRDRYFQLGNQIHRQPSAWSRMVTHLQQMTLALDNRQRVVLQGFRSGSVQSYRLLYSATSADVDLLVEAQGLARRIEGEVLPLEPNILRSPILVELHPIGGETETVEIVTESTLQGRFQFDGVPLGYYSLMITPMEGPYLTIDGIDLT